MGAAAAEAAQGLTRAGSRWGNAGRKPTAAAREEPLLFSLPKKGERKRKKPRQIPGRGKRSSPPPRRRAARGAALRRSGCPRPPLGPRPRSPSRRKPARLFLTLSPRGAAAPSSSLRKRAPRPAAGRAQAAQRPRRGTATAAAAARPGPGEGEAAAAGGTACHLSAPPAAGPALPPLGQPRTSLTERNSSSGKTKCRSKKCAILVVRSYSAILATEKKREGRGPAARGEGAGGGRPPLLWAVRLRGACAAPPAPARAGEGEVAAAAGACAVGCGSLREAVGAGAAWQGDASGASARGLRLLPCRCGGSGWAESWTGFRFFA